jgi:ABC-2 type transport system ATP-binding protein
MRDFKPPLLIENVAVGYGSSTVLSDVSLSLRSGETFGLIGLNGVGKTTLIKAILGLRSTQAGKISLFAQSNATIDSKMKCAYLPEKFEPPTFMTGIEFIQLSQQLYHRKIEMNEMIQMAQKLGLAHTALSQRVSSYSKGMRQKLGLISTLLTQCPLLILDEPMSGLDPQARVMVKEALAYYQNVSSERTVLVCSHVLADLDEICDRVGVVHDGGMAFMGTPQHLKEKTNENSLERAFLAQISDQAHEEPAAA